MEVLWKFQVRNEEVSDTNRVTIKSKANHFQPKYYRFRYHNYHISHLLLIPHRANDNSRYRFAPVKPAHRTFNPLRSFPTLYARSPHYGHTSSRITPPLHLPPTSVKCVNFSPLFYGCRKVPPPTQLFPTVCRSLLPLERPRKGVTALRQGVQRHGFSYLSYPPETRMPADKYRQAFLPCVPPCSGCSPLKSIALSPTEHH